MGLHPENSFKFARRHGVGYLAARHQSSVNFMLSKPNYLYSRGSVNILQVPSKFTLRLLIKRQHLQLEAR